MKRILILLLAMLMLCSAALAEELRLTDVVDSLMRGDAATVYQQFASEMILALTEEQTQQLWPQLTQQCGAFLGYAGETMVGEQDGFIVLKQPMDMERTDVLCTIALTQDGLIAGLNFTPVKLPSATQPPAPGEEYVTVGETQWLLPGTLTMPESNAPVPAVVLVHGSGPNDRDETVGAAKPFRDLAAELSSRGIAVLRYDKRTYIHGQVIALLDSYRAFTAEEETIRDAISAGRLLAEDPRIDASRIYVLGHSLGAMLAPRIAAESDGLFAGMILACGTNAPLTDIMLRQNEDVIEAHPESPLYLFSKTWLNSCRQSAEKLSTMTAEEAQASKLFHQPAFYFWEMMQHPAPAQYLTELALPALIINGERDFQVNITEGREGWEASLDMHAPWLTTLWADVNHMLMKPDAAEDIAGTTAEYEIPAEVDAEVAEAIAAFILTNGGMNK